MALGSLTMAGCEKEEVDYSNDFRGMWAQVAEYDSTDGYIVCDLVDELISFEGDRMYYYFTRNHCAFENGYIDCYKGDLLHMDTYYIEPHKDKCYVYYYGDEDGYLQIKGDKLYWYYDQEEYEVYERIKGFTRD